MFDERATSDRVGRYWDAVVRGDEAAADIDPGLVTAIRRVHELAPPPSAAARARVWQSVLANVNVNVNVEDARRGEDRPTLHVLMPSQLPPRVSGIGVPTHEEFGGGRRARFLAQLSTAALLLAALVGSFFAFGPGRFNRLGESPVFIPAIVATPATPQPDDSPVAEFVWQSQGDPDLPLDDPVRVAFDPQGNIWVNDGQHGRFQIFAPDGTFLETWGAPGTGDGQFDFVGAGLFGGYGGGGMTFDADGNLYVADPGNHRIQKFGPDRAFITAWGSAGQGDGQFSAVTDVAVDAQGRIFVTDEGRDDVQVFDSEGRFLIAWGDPESGWLPQPSGLTIDADGNLWIAHFSQNRVQKYAPDGTLLATIGEYGSGPGQFANPSDVAVDALGRVYVADWGAAEVQVFDSEGRFLTAWGELGLDDGQLMGLNNAVPDEAGYVYVAEDGNDRLQKFRLLPPIAPTGDAQPVPSAQGESPVEFVWQTEGGPDLPLHGPYKPAIDPAGNLWIPDGRNHRFQIFATDGTFLESWGTEGSGDGQFNFGIGECFCATVIWDAAGDFYVVDPGNFRIQKFAPDRAFITAWGSEGMGDGQFMALEEIVLDGEGRLYAVDGGRDDVQVFDRDGHLIDAWGESGAEPGQFRDPVGIAVDRDGNLYVSEYAQNRIQKLSPEGAPLAAWGGFGRGEGQFINPEDVTTDAQGRVFVVDRSNQRVQVFDSEGRFLAAWGGMAGSEEAMFDSPNGATLDGEGFIYVSDDGNDTVMKFRLLPPLAPG